MFSSSDVPGCTGLGVSLQITGDPRWLWSELGWGGGGGGVLLLVKSPRPIQNQRGEGPHPPPPLHPAHHCQSTGAACQKILPNFSVLSFVKVLKSLDLSTLDVFDSELLEIQILRWVSHFCISQEYQNKPPHSRNALTLSGLFEDFLKLQRSSETALLKKSAGPTYLHCSHI